MTEVMLADKVKGWWGVTRTWQLYTEEVRCQFLQEIRVPLQFYLSHLIWPAAYVFGALLFGASGPGLLVGMGLFRTLGSGLGLGLAVARERGQGWMRLKQASPMPPLWHFAGKVSVTLLNAVVFALGLLLVAGFAGHLPVTIGEVGVILAMITLGVLPFCALGLALAYAGGPNTAESVIVNVTVALLGLAALQFFEVGPAVLEAAVTALNTFSPAYHFMVLAFGGTGLPALQGGPAWLHGLALAGLTVAFLALAVVLYRRDEGRTHG